MIYFIKIFIELICRVLCVFKSVYSEIIVSEFEKKLTLQRYASNTIRGYKDMVHVFLKHLVHYEQLEQISISEIELFINKKVVEDKISVSYQKNLVGAIKKLFEVLLNKGINLDYLYPKRSFSKLPNFFLRMRLERYLMLRRI